MGTWITHLRIAEKLLESFPDLDAAAFTFGNLAPDSGIPNADWTSFNPPKEITHFLQLGENEGHIRDLQFYRQHLADDAQNSFLLGYFCHLLCDNLWMRRIVVTTKETYPERFADEAAATWKAVKRDWYGLDQRYVRDHPDCLFWTTMMTRPNPPSSLDFLPEHALHHQLDYIRTFYSQPPPWEFDRAYPYLNEQTLGRFVDDCTQAIIVILRQLEQLDALDGHSAIALLATEDITPYLQPLGDPQLE